MSAPDLTAHAVSWLVGSRGRGRAVVSAVDLTCRAGRVTGVLGPNGSGKTSLLRMLAGLRRPTTGSVHLGGADLSAMSPRQRARRIAVVEQESATGLPLTVRQVVELGRIPHRPRLAGGLGDVEGTDAVARALALAQVDHLADRDWATLSGGERQRAHLARALAQGADVLVLDEPTNHLDLGHQLSFLARVRELGVTTVAALHDLELAAAYCDDVAVLVDGRIVATGPADAVLTSGLVDEVYGVDADVLEHPWRRGPHVRWNGPTARGSDG